jgi:hypothetical protein
MRLCSNGVGIYLHMFTDMNLYPTGTCTLFMTIIIISLINLKSGSAIWEWATGYTRNSFPMIL